MRGMVDMHCHIIPGVDDGAATRKDVKEMLMMEYQSGVRTIILTPHYRKTMFEPSEELIRKRMRFVQRMAAEMELKMKFYLGCEYHANYEMVEEILSNKHFRINGGKFALIEFSSRHDFVNIRNWIYELRSAGIRPVIAHVERCPQIAKEHGKIEELAGLGALMQVDAGSLLGEQGWMMKSLSRKLLQKELIHFIGSDAHDTGRRYPNLDACYKYVMKAAGESYARELFKENPLKLLEDEKI